jgi:hypothetical protein
VRLEGLDQLKKSIGVIGNRTRDLPACSIVPQATTLPRVPSEWIGVKITDSYSGPPVWSSGQSFWLQIQMSRVRFPVLPDFLRSSRSGT